jgi:hypothetical protein
LLGSLFALLSGPNVPDIGFESVLSAANTNLFEVTDSVFGFGVA